MVGDSTGGGPFNITSSSGNLHSTLHYVALTQTKRLRKESKNILIHNNPSKLCLMSIALKIHVSHLKTEYLYLWFL